MSTAEKPDFFVFSDADWTQIVKVIKQASLSTPTFIAPLVPKQIVYVRSISFSNFTYIMETDVGTLIVGKSLKSCKHSINIDKTFNLEPKSINRYAQHCKQ